MPTTDAQDVARRPTKPAHDNYAFRQIGETLPRNASVRTVRPGIGVSCPARQVRAPDAAEPYRSRYGSDIGAVYSSVDYPRVDSDIGDELALRAALDPAWDAVLRAWLDGHDRYPHPFRATVRTP